MYPAKVFYASAVVRRTLQRSATYLWSVAHLYFNNFVDHL